MAFAHYGVVTFPEIPYLEISDLWVGTADDRGQYIYGVDRNVWGRGYALVDAEHYVYWIVPNVANAIIGTFKPAPLGQRGIDVAVGDAMVWRSTTGSVLSKLAGVWEIHNDIFGEGNYFTFSFSLNDDCIATPHGPWLDGETPPGIIKCHISWQRWQNNRSMGSQNLWDKYVPATTHVDDPATGERQIGVPSWRNAELGTVYRSATPTDSRGLYSYLYPDGTGFVPDTWLTYQVRWYDPETGRHYAATEPSVGADWEVGWYSESGEGEVTFTWNGWAIGYTETPELFFEMGRLL